jgi:hypothetical protein
MSMSKSLFFSLVLLLATFLSAYADEPDGDKKLSLTVGGQYAFFLNGSSLSAVHGPGVFASIGYDLSQRSSLVLSWAHQKISLYGADGTEDLASLSYKYWLTNSQKWRPWVQAGAGYEHETYEENWLGYRYRYSSSDTQMNFGGGVRYELTKDIGIDASALLYKEGAPWKWSGRTKLITTSLGADIKF